MSARHGFWVVADNRVFDGVVTRHLIAHGDIVVIHAFHDSDSYPFSNIVTRLHDTPGIRVLFYTWAGRKPLGGTTIGSVPTLDGMEDLDQLLLKDTGGNRIVIAQDNQDFLLLDPRIAEARTWLSDRVGNEASVIGSDGVALDSAVRSPDFPGAIEDPDSYPTHFDLMIQQISEATGITIFNALTRRPDQELLLAVTDGASIEFFGLNDTSNQPPTFTSEILPYLDAIGRHADRTFLVFGRGSRKTQPYTTYDEDWRWQRYLYCAYLLAGGGNTRWKHHAGFLVSPNSGRAGGLDLYADALYDLGLARSSYTVSDGCYRRGFQRGLVLVLPREAPEPKTIRVDRPMFTPDGTMVSGDLVVAPGEGYLLLRRRQVPGRAFTRRFDPANDPLWKWSELRQESGLSYLHLDETLGGQECEHDLALDLVRHRVPRGQVTLWYRTSDPLARVDTAVEVDDSQHLVRFALIDGSIATGGTPGTRPAQFRATPRPASQFDQLPVVGGGTPMIADGRWRTLVIDLDAACASSGRYEFRRAVFVRLRGSMDVKAVRVAGSRASVT